MQFWRWPNLERKCSAVHFSLIQSLIHYFYNLFDVIRIVTIFAKESVAHHPAFPSICIANQSPAICHVHPITAIRTWYSSCTFGRQGIEFDPVHLEAHLSCCLIQLYCSQERSKMIEQDSYLLVTQRSTLEWSAGGNTLSRQHHCSDTPKTWARKKLSPPQFSSHPISCCGLILLVHLANPLFLAHSFKPANPCNQWLLPVSKSVTGHSFL